MTQNKADTPPQGPKQRSSREVYRNAWMRVREDEIEFADGSAGIYGVVEKPDFALVVPLHSDGRLQLVEQYRYTVGARFWEFPQGAQEDEDTSPADMARRELHEETGLIAGNVEHVGQLYEAYGFCDQTFHVFVATDLKQGNAKHDPQELDMRTDAFDLGTVKAMIAEGTIKDAPTVSALGLLMMSGTLYW